jgi:hypothetical protein
MRNVEKAALLLASAGSAFAWITPFYLFPLTHDPTWVIIPSRFYLLAVAPAVVLGSLCYFRCGGFASRWSVRMSALLMLVGLLWTDETELGRATLLFAAFVVTLPIAALINKLDWHTPFALCFGVSTAIAVAAAAPHSSVEGARWGTLYDQSRSAVTNADGVGIQAAFAALLLITVLPRRALARRAVLVAICVLLSAAMLAAARTAVIALAVALVFAWFRRAHHDVTGASLAAITGAVLAVAIVLGASLFSGVSIYQPVRERLADTEGVVTFGDRLPIWECGMERLVDDGHRWIAGFGTGGVDKTLGECGALRTFDIGRDQVRRTYAHNTYLFWIMAFGMLGALACTWLGYDLWKIAAMMDARDQGWGRVTLLVLLTLIGMGGVINQEPGWIGIGALLWSMLSKVKTGHRRGAQNEDDSLIASRLRPAAAILRL